MKSFRILMASMAILLGAAACSGAGADESEVACDQVTEELEQAREEAQDADGTPEAPEADNRVEVLEARQQECNTSEEPTEEEDARACGNTWLVVQSDNENNRWFSGGIQEIRDAQTPEEAEEAAHIWLNQVRRDPELLAGAARYFVDREIDPATLVDEECASTEAEQLVAEMELAIASARVTPSEAPADGYNSGVNDSNVVGASQPGITGDRAAILIELPDGTKIWVMARCGNPVTEGPPPVPPGITDEPPPTTTTVPPTTIPPTTTTEKPEQDFDCQHNGTGAPGEPCDSDERQDPQDNDPEDVAPTPGAPPEPYVPPPGPEPEDDTVAPAPNEGGYDRGADDGSGTPGGSTCDIPSGCDGGGSTPPTNDPEDSGQGGTNTGTVPPPP